MNQSPEKTIQLGDISTSFNDDLAADAEDVTTASSSYSHPLPKPEEGRGKNFVKRIKTELKSLLKSEGRDQLDYTSHLETVLKQTGKKPSDFSANFNYLQQIQALTPGNPQEDDAQIFLIDGDDGIQAKGKQKYLKFLDEQDSSEENGSKEEEKEANGDIAHSVNKITHKIEMSSDEMESHLKAHEQRRLSENIVVRKVMHKGNVINFEDSLFFQGLKVPKHSLFSKIFAKRQPRFIIMNQEFFYVVSLVPNSLRMGTVKSVLPMVRLFQIRKTRKSQTTYDIRFIFFNQNFNPFEWPITKGPYRFDIQEWMRLQEAVGQINVNKQYKIKIME